MKPIFFYKQGTLDKKKIHNLHLRIHEDLPTFLKTSKKLYEVVFLNM